MEGCACCCSTAPASPFLSKPSQQRQLSGFHRLTLPLKPPIPLIRLTLRATLSSSFTEGGGGGGGGGVGGRNVGGGNNSSWDDDGDGDGSIGSLGIPTGSILLLSLFFCSRLARAESLSSSVWEVKGGKWILLVPNDLDDTFVVDSLFPSTSTRPVSPLNLWLEKCRQLVMRLMLPEGYPKSVTSDYLDYSLWRAVQGVASQISAVLATQVP